MAKAPWFVDTGYLVAILNRRDRLHIEAKRLAELVERDGLTLLTTDGVVLELANFFAASPLRGKAHEAVRRIRATPGFAVEGLSRTLLTRAEARYGAHPDKAWSLTDCASMETMLDHGVTEALTPDRHFAQAGFRVLMSLHGA